MAEHLTEEEQIEAIKGWWDANGTGLMVGVVAVLASYLGFNYWQDQKQAKAEAGSVVYEELMQAAAAPEPSDEQKTTASYLAAQLVKEHNGTFYGVYGDLLLAKTAVEANELDKAISHLNSALAQGPDEAIAPVIYQRLARVQSAKADYAAALASLDKGQSKAFVGPYAETRADIYLAQGKNLEARASYQLAMDSLDQNDFGRRQLLQEKLNSVPAATVAQVSGDSK